MSEWHEDLRALAEKWKAERADYPVGWSESARYAETAVRLCETEVRSLLAAHAPHEDLRALAEERLREHGPHVECNNAGCRRRGLSGMHCGDPCESVHEDCADFSAWTKVLALTAHAPPSEAATEALKDAAEALRKAARNGYLFLDGSVERVPWEAVARWLDERADRSTPAPSSSSDADRDAGVAMSQSSVQGLSEEERVARAVLAARSAQPEGTERVEWGVRDDDGIFHGMTEEGARFNASRVKGGRVIRRTVIEYSPVVGPWEPVEGGES